MKIGAELNLPDGFHIEWAGQFKNLEKAKLRLLMIIPVVLLLILIILLRSFNNIRQTALVFSAVPFAVTGGILSLYLRGIPFSISAAVGFIALTGIAILNGTVLVSFFNELREKGIPLVEAVYEGALTRLRPVLMTALVASLGFIPMAVNTGAGSEVQRPIATVVIGGIVSSTILTLLLLPTLYFWIEEHSGKRTPPAKYVPDESAEVFRLESEGADRKARRGRRKE
jgi:cobalt-zinc-cadmium resistance protein CzcA